MKNDDTILNTAKERFEKSLEHSSHNRKKQQEDIRFAAASPDDPWQWDEMDVQGRKQQMRPMLTINKIPQHIRQVTNDIRQNRPSIRYRPADDGSDVEVAEILMGLARHIEANSDADVAYDTATECQVVHGLGYIRVLSDYISEESFDQDIFIGRVVDPFKVHDDCEAEDPAGADRRWLFIEDSLSEDDFKDQFPKAEPIDWKFAQDGGWFSGDKRIRIVEYFSIEDKDAELLMWPDGSTSFKGEPLPNGVIEGMKPIKTRKSKKRVVMWRKMNGQEILEEKEFPSKHIPFARVIGNEWHVDGKVYISGLVRNAKDSQRMYNVAQSAIVERVMQAPKAPWIAPAEAVEGYEKAWQSANTANHAFLPYNHLDAEGNPIPAPNRTMGTVVEAGLNQIVQGASEDIKSETGQYDASLGQKSNETSGRAIMARQREGDNATFHYVDNLGRAIRHIGRIVLDMIPRIYDTQRVARILGEDGSVNKATLDPEHPEAITEFRDDQGEIQRIFNPTIGTYDVYTTSGPSFTTRRMEALDAMTAMTQANPALWQVIGDQLVKNMDWPGADEMAKRLKFTLLPEIQKDIDKESKPEEMPPQVQQAMQQMQEQVGQLDHVIQAMQADMDKAEQEKGAAVLAAQKAQAETMSLKLELQKRDALDEIEEAQEAGEESSEQTDGLAIAKEQAIDERERMKIMAQQDTTLKTEAMRIAGQIEIARINQMGAPAVDVAGDESNVIMERLMQTHEALLQHIATPKQAQISIVKNPDGSFSGQRIEM
jgi:hypothetical protein